MDNVNKKNLRPELRQKIKEIGVRIKQIRIEKHATQQHLAFSINADKSLISGIECGYFENITLLTVMRIAVALDVEINNLLMTDGH